MRESELSDIENATTHRGFVRILVTHGLISKGSAWKLMYGEVIQNQYVGSPAASCREEYYFGYPTAQRQLNRSSLTASGECRRAGRFHRA